MKRGKNICKQPFCHRKVNKGAYCDVHTPKRSNKKNRDKTYNKAAWKRLREKFLKAYPLCTQCRQNGVDRPATEVDHILPIAQGGDPFSTSNLQPLCKTHHSSKTNKERHEKNDERKA